MAWSVFWTLYFSLPNSDPDRPEVTLWGWQDVKIQLLTDSEPWQLCLRYLKTGVWSGQDYWSRKQILWISKFVLFWAWPCQSTCQYVCLSAVSFSPFFCLFEFCLLPSPLLCLCLSLSVSLPHSLAHVSLLSLSLPPCLSLSLSFLSLSLFLSLPLSLCLSLVSLSLFLSNPLSLSSPPLLSLFCFCISFSFLSLYLSHSLVSFSLSSSLSPSLPLSRFSLAPPPPPAPPELSPTSQTTKHDVDIHHPRSQAGTQGRQNPKRE